jgi:multidrug transporter EmrE-like cation transporter
MSAVYVATTVLLTVYGQLILKWQVGEVGSLPAGSLDKLEFLARLVLRPWVLSALIAAFIAALAWMAALTRLELSRAYPFVALSFVLVPIGSALFFSEGLDIYKFAGMVLIVAGIVVGSQS